MISVYHLYIVVRVYIYIYIYHYVSVYIISLHQHQYIKPAVSQGQYPQETMAGHAMFQLEGAHTWPNLGVSNLWRLLHSGAGSWAHLRTWPGPVLIHQKWSTCYAETENPWFEEFEGFLIGRRLCTATTALVRGLFSSRDLQRLEPQAAALQRGSSRVEVWNQTASNSIQMVPWTSRLRFTCCWNSFPMLPMCLCQEIWRWNRVIFSGPWSICSEKSLGLLPYLVD